VADDHVYRVSNVMNLMGLLRCEEGRRWLMIMSTGCVKSDEPSGSARL
jgi:hypothetical protein